MLFNNMQFKVCLNEHIWNVVVGTDGDWVGGYALKKKGW